MPAGGRGSILWVGGTEEDGNSHGEPQVRSHSSTCIGSVTISPHHTPSTAAAPLFPQPHLLVMLLACLHGGWRVACEETSLVCKCKIHISCSAHFCHWHVIPGRFLKGKVAPCLRSKRKWELHEAATQALWCGLMFAFFSFVSESCEGEMGALGPWQRMQ